MAVTVFHGTHGLNTNADPAALPVAENRQVYLISCNNVFVGDTGRVNRCIGAERLWSGAVHSVFNHGARLRFGSGNEMFEVAGPNTISKLCDLDSANPLAHTTIHDGSKNVSFLSDGAGSWRMAGTTVTRHEKGVYHGPDSLAAKSLTGPPAGSLLAYGLGRLWVARGNHLFMSQPNNPYLFNLGAGRLSCEDEITCLAFVKNGFWLGTAREIFYVQSDGLRFDRILKAPYGAFKGVPPACAAEMTPLQGASGSGFIIPTQRGFVFAGQDGIFANLTERVFEIRRSDLSEIAMTPYTAAIDRNRLHFCGAGYSLIMNLHTAAVTQATMLDMTACAVHGSRLYWGNADGLYSTAQSSVDAEFTVQANFPGVCRLRSLEITGEFAGTMALDMTSDEATTRTYSFIPKGGNKQTAMRCPARRDNGKGRHWRFRFYNKNGCDFSIDQVRVQTINVPTRNGGYAK